jgi:hypothetical protein
LTLCPSCGTANPSENKFCGQCAAPQRCASPDDPDRQVRGHSALRLSAAPLRTTPTAKFAAPDSYTLNYARRVRRAMQLRRRGPVRRGTIAPPGLGRS